MMIFSSLLYELDRKSQEQSAAIIMLPNHSGMPKSSSKAMAPPKISAKLVATEAMTAEAKMGTLTQRGRYLVAASDKQRPEAMPK